MSSSGQMKQTGGATPAAQDEPMPVHVAVIMDGNGRWARARGLPRHAGHRAGVQAARSIVEACGHRGIRCLTLFAFSSENWKRPRQEVRMLMKLFVEALQREVDALHENGVCLRFIGDRSRLSPALREQLGASEALTRDNTGLNLNIAVAYGGRWDVIQAARRLLIAARAGRLQPEALEEDALAAELSLAGQPDPDLLIRTGGERRISNFLIWQLAYAELYFSDVLWPEFGTAELDAALADFARRQRRFGMTGEQLEAG